MAITSSAFRRYFIKRVAFMGFSLWIISVLVFGITQVLPGNAAVMILGTFATEDSIQALEQQLGLNQPVYIQYIDWFSRVITGDWGQSFVSQRPIEAIVWPRIVHSIELALIALVMVVLIGIPLGVVAAVRRDGNLDLLISNISYIGISVPEFVTGTFLILLLGGPVFNMFPSGDYVPRSEGTVLWLRHLLLPAITLTILMLAHIMRQTRSGMIETLQSDYVRTARLKGMSEYQVLFKHALRNGLLPAITVIALDLGYLMGGIVVVEEVFAFPGLGRLIIFSINNRDLPTLQVVVLIVAATYTIANFAADIMYTYLDPRIEYGDS
jgi:peptide/nickel transport system permease protein